jgi:Ppx/GppA phosphatase family
LISNYTTNPTFFKQIMARLTGFSRFLIAALIVAGIYFAVRTFLPNLGIGSGNSTTSQTESPSGNASNDEQGSSSATTSDAGSSSSSAAPAGTISFPRSNFNFSAPLPANGKLKGVVELGATGFNSFIVRIDAQKNWKLEKAEFGRSLVKEGMASEDDVKTGLKQYIADMVDYGVGPRDIHFVISSGAKKSPTTDVIIRTLEGMKYRVNTVTPEQEGQLAYRAAMAKGYSGRGFVVDIGSGNTKIAWQDRGNVRALEGVGAKYYQDKMTAESAASDIRSKASQVPSNLREVCFIIGGAPYDFAKKVGKKEDRYTVLPAPADVKAEGEKQIAGQNIYNALAQATNCKQFVFDWDANFTIGFLLGLP